MNELFSKIIESWIIYWEWAEEIIASNILDSDIWETIVVWVCKWISVLADEEWKTIEEIVSKILEEDEEDDLYIM